LGELILPENVWLEPSNTQVVNVMTTFPPYPRPRPTAAPGLREIVSVTRFGEAFSGTRPLD